VKALLSRRGRPSALGYARLADVDQVLQAVTQAYAEAGASDGTAAQVDVVRDSAGRRRLAQGRRDSARAGSRPSAWAGARTAAAVTDPDPRIRRAVSAMSVFRTAFGELSLPGSELAMQAEASGSGDGARVGRHVLRTADGRFVSPATGGAAPARSRSMARAATDGATRTTRSAYGVDTDTVVTQSADENGLVEADGVPAAGGASPAGLAGRAAQVGSGASRPGAAYRKRPGLQSTLGEVDEFSGARHELPVWARRASGAPLVRSSDQREVFTALARAKSPEQVVQVIAQHGAELGSMPSSLPAPVIKVIEQVREGARQDLEARFQAARDAAAGEESTGARSAPTPSKSGSTEPQLLRAVKGLQKTRRARTQGGQGDDRVMKLAKRLQSLIHLAEGTGDRNEARRHVRMAEDSAAARQEGQGTAGAEAGASQRDAQVDIDALVNEVVRSANSELAMRRQRRQEDPDGGKWW